MTNRKKKKSQRITKWLRSKNASHDDSNQSGSGVKRPLEDNNEVLSGQLGSVSISGATSLDGDNVVSPPPRQRRRSSQLEDVPEENEQENIDGFDEICNRVHTKVLEGLSALLSKKCGELGQKLGIEVNRLVTAEFVFLKELQDDVLSQIKMNVQREIEQLRQEHAEKQDVPERAPLEQPVEKPQFPEDEVSVLKSVVSKFRKDKNEYCQRTIIISGFEDMRHVYEHHDHRRRALGLLTGVGLDNLLYAAEKFYLTSNNVIRLTYSYTHDAARWLVHAKRGLKELKNKCVRVCRMVPKQLLELKRRLLQAGSQMKRFSMIYSYDVVYRESNVKLRVFGNKGIEYLSGEDIGPGTIEDINTEMDGNGTGSIPVILGNRQSYEIEI